MSSPICSLCGCGTEKDVIVGLSIDHGKETFYCQQELFGMKGMIYEEYVEECKEIEQRIYKETD